jgi:RNA polymerase sigma-70 factor, ECF subfamily
MSKERPAEGINQPGELEALMRRYQQSDSEAAASLVRLLSPRIYRFYFAYVRERPLAEDLLQEFWLRIHSARRTYRPGEPVLPWAYAIARRVRIDHYRRHLKTSEHEIQSEQLPQMAAPETRSGTSSSLTDLLETLPAAQREVILLLKVSGLTLEEVARATGTSVGAVKQKAHRAYEKLRQLFGSET